MGCGSSDFQNIFLRAESKGSKRNAAICIKYPRCLNMHKVFLEDIQKMIIPMISGEENCLWDGGKRSTFCFSYLLNFKICKGINSNTK